MHPNIKTSPILTEFHHANLREHKFFLQLLLSEERSQAKLRKMYDEASPKQIKKKKNIKSKIKPRARGHQRKSFDYETAMSIVRSEGIMSLAQYRRWYQLNTPARMPKFPERAYKRSWTGWGDFLGVYNTYTRRPGDKTNGKGKYRTFEDAKKFAASLNCNTIQDWKDYIATGNCPMDIPHRPDIVYSRGTRKEYWLSWKDFLGYGIHNTVDKIQLVSPVLYIAKKQNGPTNVYVINVIPGGKPALIDHLSKIQARLISAFYTNATFDHKSALSSLSGYPYGGIDEFMIPNIYDVLDVLQDNMSQVV